jgi:hypothetical protein
MAELESTVEGKKISNYKDFKLTGELASMANLEVLTLAILLYWLEI